MSRFLRVSVTALWISMAGAWAAGATSGAPPDIWEIREPSFQHFEATRNSELARRILALPVTEDLVSAETARVALYIVRLNHDAALLVSATAYGS